MVYKVGVKNSNVLHRAVIPLNVCNHFKEKLKVVCALNLQLTSGSELTNALMADWVDYLSHVPKSRKPSL